jgi:hypothetical protein
MSEQGSSGCGAVLLGAELVGLPGHVRRRERLVRSTQFAHIRDEVRAGGLWRGVPDPLSDRRDRLDDDSMAVVAHTPWQGAACRTS